MRKAIHEPTEHDIASPLSMERIAIVAPGFLQRHNLYDSIDFSAVTQQA
jgi:hypothetical protein